MVKIDQWIRGVPCAGGQRIHHEMSAASFMGDHQHCFDGMWRDFDVLINIDLKVSSKGLGHFSPYGFRRKGDF